MLEHHMGGPHNVYSTHQGRFVGRDGTVHIEGPVDDRRFWIGGATRTVLRGQLAI